jgi:hypothetical protein
MLQVCLEFREVEIAELVSNAGGEDVSCAGMAGRAFATSKARGDDG